MMCLPRAAFTLPNDPQFLSNYQATIARARSHACASVGAMIGRSDTLMRGRRPKTAALSWLYMDTFHQYQKHLNRRS